MLKFLVWHVLLVAVSCELFNQELGYRIEYAPKYDDYQPRDYHFDYAVSDPHTGDHKSQWEVKEKGVVRGAYSLLEPDGTTRIVEYIADDHGFRAVVKKLGAAVHEVPVQVPLPEVHYRTYDGQVNNYANVEVPPVLYRLEQSLGHGAVLSQQGLEAQYLGRAEVQPQAVLSESLGRIEGPEIEAVPVPPPQIEGIRQIASYVRPTVQTYGTGIAQGQYLGGIGAQGYRLDQSYGTGVPQGGIETHRSGPVTQTYGTGISQGQYLGGIEARLGKIEVVPHEIQRSGPVAQSYGTYGAGIAQGQYLGGIEASLGKAEVVPQVEIQRSGPVAQAYGTYGGGIAQGQYSGGIEASLGRGEVVPQLEIQRSGPVAQSYGSYGGGVAQGQYLGGIEASLGRAEVVPQLEIQRSGPVAQSYSTNANGRIQGGYLARFQTNLGRAEVVPQVESHGSGSTGQNYGGGIAQGQYLGGIERVEVVPQVETHRSGSYGSDGTQGQYLGRSELNLGAQAVPGLVPVSPSYSMTVEYHGLTGNPDDDSHYTRDEYHGSASQRVPKVVPAPTSKVHPDHKQETPTKEKFLIYIPDSESH